MAENVIGAGMIYKSALLVALSAAVMLADDDDRPRRRVRLGGIMVGASYTSGRAWGPGWGYPGYYPGWWGYNPAFGSLYSPFWYSPWIHPGLLSGFGQGPNMGEVRLTGSKTASVYVDGAYAGPANKLKSMWLEPGVYNLELRDAGGSGFERKIYVLSGKTLDLRAPEQP